MPVENRPRAAYVHIPFCQQICYYCDFAKVLLEGQPVEDYIDAVADEFDSYGIRALSTLYIGGGTPTALTPGQLSRLLSRLTARLDLSQLTEFTVEANPSDLTDEMVAALADSPVNRVSVGVQTFDDRLLARIGRAHTAVEADRAIARLRAAGFDNLTIDLIYGLPSESLETVRRDVTRFLELDLPHVALYSLILEDHTIFMNRERRGLLRLPSDDRNADMYEFIVEALSDAGYQHYEISNFAKPGYESRHNLTYWDNAEYYGVGAGASGYVNGIRYKNHGPVHHYLDAGADKRVTSENLTRQQKIEEEMFLGLRKADGVSRARFQEKFAASLDSFYATAIAKLTAEGLLADDGDRLALTPRGFELGNEAFQEFLLD